MKKNLKLAQFLVWALFAAPIMPGAAIAMEETQTLTPQKQRLLRRLVANYKELRELRAKRRAGTATPPEIKKLENRMRRIRKGVIAAGLVVAFLIAIRGMVVSPWLKRREAERKIEEKKEKERLAGLAEWHEEKEMERQRQEGEEKRVRQARRIQALADEDKRRREAPAEFEKLLKSSREKLKRYAADIRGMDDIVQARDFQNLYRLQLTNQVEGGVSPHVLNSYNRYLNFVTKELVPELSQAVNSVIDKVRAREAAEAERMRRPSFSAIPAPKEADLIQIDNRAIALRLNIGTAAGRYPWWIVLGFKEKPDKAAAATKFRGLTSIHHPDKPYSGPHGEEVFKVIGAAYEKSQQLAFP